MIIGIAFDYRLTIGSIGSSIGRSIRAVLDFI
jgi:hypothetical protein